MDFFQDVRFSMRLFRKNPGFTFAAVFALALSIGANVSVFSVVYSVLLRPLLFRQPEQLVAMWSVRPDNAKFPFTLPSFRDYLARNRVFQEMAAQASWNANLTGEAQPERLLGVRVSANYFTMLGVEAILGRTLIPRDDTPGEPKVVLLTYPLWQGHFGGDTAVVGKSLLLNGEPYSVVGVLPPSFRILMNGAAELVVPLSPDTDPFRANRNSSAYLRVFGRLKPGVRIEDATADLNRISTDLLREFPNANAGNLGIRLTPLKLELVGGSAGTLWILAAAVAIVLLMVCANQASLLIAKAAARQKEMAVRAALGGSRTRLFRQLLTENAVLSIAGGALGAMCARWGVKLLLVMSPQDLPRTAEVRVDPLVLAIIAAVSVLCGIVFGSIPAMHVLRRDLHDALRSDAKGNTGGVGRGNLRRALVIGEVALSVILLAGAGLLIRSFLVLQRQDPGFRSDNVLTARLALPATRYKSLPAVMTFHDRLLERLSALPGVKAAGAINILPLSGPQASADFEIRGRATAKGKAGPTANYRTVDAGFFDAMQIPILRGRGIAAADTERTQAVAVIADSTARKYWPNENPVGSHILLDDNSVGRRDVEVVGVVADIRALTLEEDPMSCVYVPLTQLPAGLVRFVVNNFFWVVRATQSPLALSAAMGREVHAVDGDVASAAVLPMTSYLQRSLAARRFSIEVLGVFAGAALLLATVGLYALVSYSVTQRRREIGVRIALGAGARDVLWLILRDGVEPAAIGVAIGIAGAIAGSRFMSSLVFGLGSRDPSILTEVAALLIAVAAAASYIPARIAVRIDPMVAWRSE